MGSVLTETVLGATFATLYPERVGKFVLDGVMQDEPWYLNGRQDTLAYQDEAISQFFSQCSEAGSARCSFWAGSAKQTEARYERLLETIERNPLRVPYSAVVVDVPIFITADTVRTAVFQASYHGHTSFRDLADRLADLERGFYKSWLGNGPGVAKIPTPSCSNCSLKDWNTLFETFPNSDSNKELFSPNAHSGIMCTDLVPQDIPSLEAYTEYMDTSWNSSHYAGFTGADLANCRSWPFRPPPSQRFNAKFGASLKQPMLVLTNTFDPVCPAAYARQVEHQFPGSVLLEQRAIGHGAATLGSACTEGHVRDYFETGRLPSPGTVCVPDKKPVLLQDVEIERNG
jgi:pimeloyl-ACP methyl ester carboxylesterase